MKEAFGDIWQLIEDNKYDAVVITTNGFVKKNGEAVMGRGIALEAKTRFPKFPAALGKQITAYGNYVFGFKDWDQPYWFFTLPVKPAVGPKGEPGWKAKADIRLIVESIKQLDGLLFNLKNAGYDIKSVIMPRPGCGNGGLKWEDVKPAIEPYLDDRFTVVTNGYTR